MEKVSIRASVRSVALMPTVWLPTLLRMPLPPPSTQNPEHPPSPSSSTCAASGRQWRLLLTHHQDGEDCELTTHRSPGNQTVSVQLRRKHPQIAAEDSPLPGSPSLQFCRIFREESGDCGQRGRIISPQRLLPPGNVWAPRAFVSQTKVSPLLSAPCHFI